MLHFVFKRASGTLAVDHVRMITETARERNDKEERERENKERQLTVFFCTAIRAHKSSNCSWCSMHDFHLFHRRVRCFLCVCASVCVSE